MSSMLDLSTLPLSDIDAVVFYKRDEITTDLICCDIEAKGQVWTTHEDAADWDDLIARVSRLPNFKGDWYSAVARPAFAPSETVAFRRA